MTDENGHLVTYNEFQKGGPDYDGDTLINGDEIYIGMGHLGHKTHISSIHMGESYIVYRSSPVRKDTDNDEILDAEDIVPLPITLAFGSIRVTTGRVYNLYDGWKIRFDDGTEATKTMRHIHVYRGNEKYSQNEDGSSHDGNKGDPPNSLKKEIKKQFGWDWDAKKESYYRHNFQLTFNETCDWEHGNCTCKGTVGTWMIEDGYKVFVPFPNVGYFPSLPIPVPIPQPVPVPVFKI